MWNLKNKLYKENSKGLIATETKLMFARGEGVGRLGRTGEGNKKYKYKPVTGT